MKLPFLQDSKWPVIREDEERVVNPSSDTQLQDHLVDQLMVAIEKNNHEGRRDALMALVQAILNEESSSEV